eukprot:scaffold3577_cov414-Prasinococcus_capsulatus_cf.AAC.7
MARSPLVLKTVCSSVCTDILSDLSTCDRPALPHMWRLSVLCSSDSVVSLWSGEPWRCARRGRNRARDPPGLWHKISCASVLEF